MFDGNNHLHFNITYDIITPTERTQLKSLTMLLLNELSNIGSNKEPTMLLLNELNNTGSNKESSGTPDCVEKLYDFLPK